MNHRMENGQAATGAWLQVALERLLSAEHRVTILEWTSGGHEKRIAALEADAQAVRDGLLRLFRGLAVFGVTFGLGHVLSGGALSRALMALSGQ